MSNLHILWSLNWLKAVIYPSFHTKQPNLSEQVQVSHRSSAAGIMPSVCCKHQVNSVDIMGQQHNTSCHKATMVKEWFEEHSAQVADSASRSQSGPMWNELEYLTAYERTCCVLMSSGHLDESIMILQPKDILTARYFFVGFSLLIIHFLCCRSGGSPSCRWNFL